MTVVEGSRPSNVPRATGGATRAPALADDRAAHAQGLDGSEGGRRPARRGHLPIASGAHGARSETNPEHLAAARDVAAQLPAGGALRRRRRRSARSWPALPPRGDRRMSANPHANGGLLLRDLALPDFRDYAVEVPRPRWHDQRGDAVLGTFLRDVIVRNPDNVPAVRAGRDGLQPAGGGLRGHRPRLERRASCRATTTWLPSGRVMEVLSEHLCQGWLEGYLLTGRHGLVQLLRGLHPHRRLDVQPARQVAEGDADIPWRRPIASLNYLLTSPRLAPGPQRLHPPGPGLHRPRRQQEGRDRPGLPAAGRQHACSRWPTTACAAATTSTSSSPASSPR